MVNTGTTVVNEVDAAEKAEFLRWEKELPIVSEKSIDQKTAIHPGKREFHVFADTSEDTMCSVAYLQSQPKEHSVY